MKLLDRIALQRLISMLLTFILAVLKMFAPKTIEDDSSVEDDKRWRPRWRRKKK
jgi:hypothetical protein